MSHFRVFLFFTVICSLTVLGHGDNVPFKTELIELPVMKKASSQVSDVTLAEAAARILTESATSKPSDPSSKSEPSPIPNPTPLNTTTTITTSTTPSTTTSTTPATTTSTTPATTTSTTSTTPTPTPEPTPAPSPAPSPAPKPLPPPEPGMWSYTDKGTNFTCILVQFAAQLNVTYTKDNSNTTDYVQLNVPKNASVVDGSCANDTQWVKLSWPATENSSNTMLLVFESNHTTKWYELKSLNVSLVPEVFYNASFKEPVELWHGVEWRSPLATSYRCAPPTHLNMSAEATNVVAKLTLSQLQEEAFRVSKDKAFSSARECGGGDVPDAVPIAVGCALGGLVLVVLAAYLVGRRRSAARGYLSM